MKTKHYIADFNADVVAKFDFAEITLRYRNAHKNEEKKGALYAMITEGTDFIAVGTEDNYKKFNNWYDAAEYAKTLTGDYYVAVRPSGHIKYEVLAKCENKAETITEAAPAEAEDNNVYFTYNDIYEALNTILNAKSSKVQVELHKISDITDIPKSMCFYRQPCGNIGINFINYCDAEDPLAECYDFAEDYLRENASDIAFELSYRPFNDDPHPQSEDITEAAPAEDVAQSENVLAYEDDIYTYNVEDNGDRKSADYETIDELINWAKKFPYKWFKVNNNDRLSFQFKRETYDDGGHQYRLYMHDNYGVLGDNNWYICNRITYNKAYKLMGKIMDCMWKANDNMPQTEDFYFKTEEYKKAEAEAVKALPF